MEPAWNFNESISCPGSCREIKRKAIWSVFKIYYIFHSLTSYVHGWGSKFSENVLITHKRMPEMYVLLNIFSIHPALEFLRESNNETYYSSECFWKYLDFRSVQKISSNSAQIFHLMKGLDALKFAFCSTGVTALK